MQVVRAARQAARYWEKHGFEPTQACAAHFLHATDKITRRQSEKLNEIQAYIGTIPLPKGKRGLTKALGWQAMATIYVFGSMVGISRIHPDTYICLPRKQGKTSYAAALGIAMLKYCPDVAPKVYSVATKRDQANLVLEDARNSIRQMSPVTARGYIRGGLGG